MDEALYRVDMTYCPSEKTRQVVHVFFWEICAPSGAPVL